MSKNDSVNTKPTLFDKWHANVHTPVVNRSLEYGMSTHDDDEALLQWLSRARRIATSPPLLDSALKVAEQSKNRTIMNTGSKTETEQGLVVVKSIEFARNIQPESFVFKSNESKRCMKTRNSFESQMVDENIHKDKSTRNQIGSPLVEETDDSNLISVEEKATMYHHEKISNDLKDKKIEQGLGSTLGMLRFRGNLSSNSDEWAGRHNDKKLLPHQNLVKKALFSGIYDKDDQTLRLEAALRRTDEYGRVLTAKEAFRELCV